MNVLQRAAGMVTLVFQTVLALLAAMLLLTAIQKALNFGEFQTAVLHHGTVPTPVVPYVSVLVVVAEAVAGGLTVIELASSGRAWRGATGVVLVLASLTGYTMFMWLSGKGDGVNCGCGLRFDGGSQPWWRIAAQDGAMLVAAVAAQIVLSGKGRRTPHGIA